MCPRLICLLLIFAAGCSTKAIPPSAVDQAVLELERADWAYTRGNVEEAIARYTEVLRLAPFVGRDPRLLDGGWPSLEVKAYKMRGGCYLMKFNYEESIADFTMVIELDPSDATALYNRGVAYDSLKAYDMAIADYSESIRHRPEEGIGYVSRAEVYLILGRPDDAIRDCTAAIRLSHGDRAYFVRGSAYLEREQFEKAIADLTQAINHKGLYRAEAYAKRGNAYAAIGDHSKANDDHHEAKRW